LDGSGHRKERKGSSFLREIAAGIATFFAMAYIISVNASIVKGRVSTIPHSPTDTDKCNRYRRNLHLRQDRRLE